MAFTTFPKPSRLATKVNKWQRTIERVHGTWDHILLDITGNADETLTFTERDRETGAVIRTWESPA